MKHAIISLLCCAASIAAFSQYKPKDYFEFRDKKEMVFVEDFNHTLTDWQPDIDGLPETCILHVEALKQANGIYYVNNNCDEGIGIVAPVNIDYTRNFEIVLVARVKYDLNDDTSLHFGYLRWNEHEQNDQFETLFFAGFINEFHTHLSYDSIKKRCEGIRKSLKPARNTYDEFVRYTIRKYNNKYYIFINGLLKGTFPYANLNGSGIAIGARENSKIEFDHLSVYYLP